jgi:aminoglycoside phosphotransferase (APT) family kinase protein
VPGIANSGPGWIETEFVTGRHGQDLIDAGDATAVLSECGHALAELHRIDPRLLDPAAPPRTVIRHGDFGPNNVLLDADTGATSAVLDWEFSGVGNVLADVAWCEWIVRMHHPTAIDALDDFFDAYGQRPSWTDRQQEMVRRCEWLEDFACRGDPDGPGVETWRQRRRIAEAWTE